MPPTPPNDTANNDTVDGTVTPVVGYSTQARQQTYPRVPRWGIRGWAMGDRPAAPGRTQASLATRFLLQCVRGQGGQAATIARSSLHAERRRRRLLRITGPAAPPGREPQAAKVTTQWHGLQGPTVLGSIVLHN